MWTPTHPNNFEPDIFIKLFMKNLTPHLRLLYVTLEWPLNNSLISLPFNLAYTLLIALIYIHSPVDRLGISPKKN